MEALAMEGYGGYVWTAFGFALVAMGGLLWQSWRAQAWREAELKTLRSTVRATTDDGTARRPRRLVASKPVKAPDGDNLATPGSASGT